MAQSGRAGHGAYRAASRFVLRTPLLPFDAVTSWGTDVDSSRAALRTLVDDPVVREALFVASPDLEATIADWMRNPDTVAGHATERGLVRYVVRMARRATPFGLCSGISTGTTNSRTTALELEGRNTYRRDTRLDNDYLFAVCNELARHPTLARELRYRPSSSLYQVAGRLRYAEARLAGTARTHHLVGVEPSEYLLAVLERARTGATREKLADVLCAPDDSDRDEATAFIDELVTTQLLVTELQPPITGPEPTGEIVALLEQLPSGRAHAAPLESARRQIEDLDATPLGASRAAYQAIVRTLAALPGNLDARRMFQVDLYKPPVTAALGGRVTDTLVRGIDLLQSIAGATDDLALLRFKQAFVARYETREVPLVEALDEELGIGFDDGAPPATPLLADLALPTAGEPRRTTWGRREVHLLALATRCVRAGTTAVELTDDDIEQLNQPPARLPETITVSAVLVGTADQVAQGRAQVWLRGVDGPGARMLGRFCHGSSDVEVVIRELVAAQQAADPEAVFAEIVHLPEERIGNILLRPVLRSHEIVYLGASGAAADSQIAVTDLVVSIVRDRVVVRSRRLGREVVPCLTTAHNYNSRSLGVYRFLCTLGNQRGRGVSFSWGALGDAPFLPRLTRGNLILTRARWRLDARDLAPLEAASRGSNAATTAEQLRALRARRVAAVCELRQRLGLPRWIALADGDNELAIDLDNPLMADSFAQLVKARPFALVFELLPDGDALCVHGPEGVFAHELLVPMVRRASAAPRSSRVELAPAPVVRRFPPGSQWLFVKVYTGTVTADVLLREVIRPLVHGIVGDCAQSWFFIRYGDPDWHLRIRFSGQPERLLHEALPRVQAALAPTCDAGLVWRVKLDTYEREVERYGGPAAIALAENIFAADSDAALQILSTYEGDAGADAMWRIALRGIDRLLDDLGFDLAGKLDLMRTMRDSFGAEHGMTTAVQRRLGERFRAHRDEIAELLARPDEASDHPLAAGFAALATRSRAIAPGTGELRALASRGALVGTLVDLAPSFIHMHVNRLLQSAHRSQELVLYDLLRRHYDGVAARARQGRRS